METGSVEALIEELRTAPPGGRPSLLEALRRADSAAVRPLCAALRYLDPRTQLGVLRILGEIGDGPAVEALFHVARTGSTPARQFAGAALGRLTDPRAVPVVQRMLETGDTASRVLAAQAAGSLRNSRLLPGLCQCLEEGVGSLTIEACGALGKFGHPGAALSLRKVLRNADCSQASRLAAAASLEKIGDPTAVRALCGILDSPASPVRARCREALVRLGPAAVSGLMECFDDKPFVADDALFILADIGEPAEPALLQALTHPTVGVRARAARILGKRQSPVALPLLLDLLEHRSSWLRGCALLALGDLGETSAAARIEPFLRHEDSSQRIRAAMALTALGAARTGVTAGLIQGLSDESVSIRHACAEGLALQAERTGDPGLREALPVLKRRCRPWSGEDDALKEAYRVAIHRIMRATAAAADLPLPAASAARPGESLPLPARGNPAE